MLGPVDFESCDVSTVLFDCWTSNQMCVHSTGDILFLNYIETSIRMEHVKKFSSQHIPGIIST